MAGKKNNLISVIIPTYNRAKYLDAAIGSVLGQKGEFYKEVVVIDDGSTDNTAKIVRKYKDVRYYQIKHSGLPAVARNFGISKARGQLIAFQDSDDAWPPDKLARQVPLFDDPEVIMSYGQAQAMNSTGRLKKQKLVAEKKITYGQDFKLLLKENVISTLTVVVRKDALEQVGGFNESRALRAVEDYELWLRLAAKYPGGIKAMAATLAHYRIHAQNISGAGSLLAIERLIGVYDSLWQGDLLDQKQRLALEEQLSIMHENWSRQQNIDGNTPTISVVMSMFNSARYLREAVNSILKQTYKDFEFIIIDDGSSDKSAAIIRSYKDRRIRLVHQTNHGLVYSFNKGLKLARAEYLARMDSDDISMPSRFKKELDWLKDAPERGLVGTYFAYVDKKSKRTSVTMVWPTKHTDILRMMYITNPFGHGTIMARREAMLDVGGYRAEYEPAEDFDLWSRIAQHWEIGQIPEVLYLWRLHYKNVSHTDSVVQNRSADKIIENLWQAPPAIKPFWEVIKDARYYKKLDSTYNQRVHREYSDNQSRLAADFLNHGYLWIGYKNAFAAFFLNPRLTLSYWETFLRTPIRHVRSRK